MSVPGPVYNKYEFLRDAPELAIPCLIVLGIASLVGTFGNIMILIVVAKTRELKQVQSIFIVNLALSDLYVTTIADTMSIVGKIEGRPFFEKHHRLCKFVGMMCTMSCISSLGSITLLSFNRYVFICYNTHYKKLFNPISCVAMCITLYCVGLVMTMLNWAGVGDHGFDDKSLECIWDRMATYWYTVFLSVCLVWVPLLVVGVSYFFLFKHVHEKGKQMADSGKDVTARSLKLAKTMFIVYILFSLCWVPFAILLVADSKDTFAHEVHLLITVFAHIHPSINWAIYYTTNRNFKKGFQKIFGCYNAVASDEGSSVNTTRAVTKATAVEND